MTEHYTFNPRLLITAIGLLLCNLVYSQTSNFTVSPSTGNYCTPQSITFTQTSSGSPTAFLWDFGNGERGNEPVVEVIYDRAGTYNVTLITVYNNVAVQVTKSIIVNETPSINLTADRYELCKPGSVAFTASSSSSVTSYEWDFGDGTGTQYTTTNTVVHEFSNYQNHRVVVKGITNVGCSMTSSVSINVSKFQITAVVSAPDSCIPVRTTFDINAVMVPGDAQQSILWQFGDGSPNETNNSSIYSHTYNTTNNITTAKVTITTVQGCVNEYNFPLFAYGIPPTGINAYTTSGRDTFCGSESVEFYANATNANLYTYDLGGGVIKTSTTNYLNHKFPTLGWKEVIITPSFNGCKGQKDTVRVYIQGVIAYFDINNTCEQKNGYVFKNVSLGNIDHYAWSFSDTPGFLDSVNYDAPHLFPRVGTHWTKLFLIDSITGCRDSLIKDIYTALPVFSSSLNTVCKDSLLVYSVLNTYPKGVGYEYVYNINGSVVSPGDSTYLPHYPTTHGIFNDFVIINDGLPGTCSDTIPLGYTTRVRGPIADFTLPERVCEDTAVKIINTSYPFYPGETINKWNWDFSDATYSNQETPPPHLYRYDGTYSINLIVKDINGCGAKTNKRVTINPLPKVNILPKWDTICGNQSKELIAYSTDEITWAPTTSLSCPTCDTVTVTPTASINYVALATSIYSCKKRDTAFIMVYQPFNLTVTPADTAVCPGGFVQYNLNKNGIIAWTPTDFLSNTSIRNPISRPLTDIRYRVVVSDSARCFSDSAFADLAIHPPADVNAGPDLLLDYGTPFTLNPLYSEGIRTYLWTPGDSLSCSNCRTPSSVARTNMMYKIQVQDIHGCTAEDEIKVILNCATSRLYLPNAFTPNNDGKNDYFYPIAYGYEIVKSFVIFNRSGYKVFERKNFRPNDPSLGWNGQLKGNNDQNTQSYVWYAEVECFGKSVIKKGNLVLIR